MKQSNGMAQSTVFSVSIDLRDALHKNRFPEDYAQYLVNGKPAEPFEVAALLVIEQAKGNRVIPGSGECGNPCKHSNRGCSGFDFTGGGCPGRRV